MARKAPPPPYLNELRFDARQHHVPWLRDGHLQYLDPHLLPLLRDEARSVTELDQLARGRRIEGVDEHLIWRWLQSAWKRSLVSRASGPFAPGGERMWRITDQGLKRAGAPFSDLNNLRGRVMAVVAPILAAFGGVAGFAATVQEYPLLAFVLLGFAIGGANRLVFDYLLIQHYWLRGRIVLAHTVQKESELQAFLRSGKTSPTPPSVEPTSSRAALLLVTSPRATFIASFFMSFGLGFSFTGFAVLLAATGDLNPYLVFTIYWLFFFSLQDVAFTYPGLWRTWKLRRAEGGGQTENAREDQKQPAQPAPA